MIIQIEKISKCTCHGSPCSLCNKQAIGRLYTQTEYDHKHRVKNTAFYFCADCGKNLGSKLIDYSN